MIEFIVTYWWHILSVCISPLAGFAWAQMYKVGKKPKPGTLEIALFNAFVTAGIALILWPGGITEKLKMALVVGSVWPFIVLAWFKLTHKYAPEQYESLAGNNGEFTLIPGIKVKIKHKDESVIPDGQPLDFDITAPDITKCPDCGGPADNGHDRHYPPNPYRCSKCNLEQL